jgi:hypothetical protein
MPRGNPSPKLALIRFGGSQARADDTTRLTATTSENASIGMLPGCRSPRYRQVFQPRERTRGAVRGEQRNAHHRAGAFPDRLPARISVEIRLRAGRENQVYLDPGLLQLDRHGQRYGVTSLLGRRVNGSEHRVISHTDMAPGEWIHLRIVVDGAEALCRRRETTCLLIHDLKRGDVSGGVALWIGPGTEGYFRNLAVGNETHNITNRGRRLVAFLGAMRGGHSCPQPPFQPVLPPGKAAAAMIGRPTKRHWATGHHIEISRVGFRS